MENMDKLGNIALEYAIFLDGWSLYEEGSLWYFWWNFPALETGFPLVGREKGFRGSIIRARVLERKPKHKIITGAGVVRGPLGKF